MTLYVKSDVDCYIEIYDIASDGSTMLVFPNRYWEDRHGAGRNFIRAGVRTRIPQDNSFKLQVFSPYGVDMLKLIASTRPLGGPGGTRALYDEKGAFPSFGNIGEVETVRALKSRAIGAVAGDAPSGPALLAQTYCTVLTRE